MKKVKKPRALEIMSLMYWAGKIFLTGDKLKFIQGSVKLEQLGGLYIKFLQLIVINLDPENQRNYQQMLEVYEHSPPDKLNIWNYLKSELPNDKLALFQKLASEPFATGSFGQVYYAQLTNGDTVIVKVLRPSVQQYLHYDLRLLSVMSRIYNLVDRQNVLNFRAAFKQFRTTSLEEVNYLNEAAVASHYYDAYKDHPNLVIPKTYRHLSTSRVIVQECLVGESLTKLLAMKTKGEDAVGYVAQHLGSDLLLQLDVVGTELLGRAVTGQIMHADPHPGNIILMCDNKVALIDFGMSTVLSSNRVAFYQMLVQYVDFYSGDFTIGDLALSAFKFLQRDLFEAITQAETLLTADGHAKEPIMDKIKAAVTEIFYDESNSVIISQLMASRSLMRMLFFTINRGNRFGFRFDLEAINLIKAAQGYSVLMANFDPEGKSMTNVLEKVVKMAEANFDLVIDSKEANGYTNPQEALEVLSCWVDKMARSDPVFMNKLTMEHIN